MQIHSRNVASLPYPVSAFYTLALIATFLVSLPAAKLLAQQGSEPNEYLYRPVTITAGGYVPGLIAHPTDPGLIYARTDIGSVYRWEPQDNRWQPLTDFQTPADYNYNGPESVALDPTDPNRLYIAAGMYAYANCCAFLVSNDRGATFQIYPSPFEMASNDNGRAAGERMAVNPFKPNELFMGTRFNGLWVSENRAQTWKQVASFPVQSSTDTYGVQWVVFDPKTSGTIYVGSFTTATVYVSTNDGATWSALPGQPIAWPASYSVRSGTNPPAPERALINPDGDLYVTFDDLPGPNVIDYGLVEKYSPSTRTWTNITPPIDTPFQTAPSGGFVGITQDPTRAGTVAISTMDRWYPVDTVYVTHNSGSTWINLGLVTSSAGDDGPPNGNYYFNTDVFAPTPYLTFGDTNTPNSPHPSSKFGWWMSALLIDPTNPDHLMYGTGATIYATDNVSAADVGISPNWFVQAQGIEETAVLALISPTSGAHLLSGVGDIGGFVHTDFDVSPQTGMYTNPVATTVGSLDWAGQNPSFIVRAQSPATASTRPCNYGAFSTNGGASWHPFPTCATRANSGNGGSISVDASGTTVMWTPPSHGTVQFSTDNGSTWLATTGIPESTPVYADKVTPQRFYAFTNSDAGSVLYSATVDTARRVASFSQVNTSVLLPTTEKCYGSGCGSVVVNWAKAGDLWLPLGSDGLFHSTDAGVTWTNMTNVSHAYSVAIGAASPSTHQQAVFLYGEASDGGMAIYRSDDDGSSWVRINSDSNQYGGPTLIQADPRVYGRVYLGMNGRGIIYGDLVTQP